ncbi:MAG: TIGR03667 family PPOX class F420-dependent oxidoreductase [Bacillati bacterium ANGP1]|uniref:TIGR03667 family PPOX class F420-dependent oxidoreductase n=1 Tax=Candidatus Segetimicrobium genomatis TaxID=2569760 RepID=A0A537LPB0_9BACT|nr:MAG: TIGR03667 family PPOX class F420-dependent oxidoreductase [Terrabacteria group bacterium ANGP1]
MVDFTSRLGRRINRRLTAEKIIWLTTVDSRHTPQPRPVWFHWDGQTILIFSERDKAKLRHIAQNPRVALSFNTDEDGNNVGVVIGEAKILGEQPPTARVKAYLRKYREGVKDIGMTVPEFTASFAIPILVSLQAIRGS